MLYRTIASTAVLLAAVAPLATLSSLEGARAADAVPANVQAAIHESQPLRIPDDIVRDAARNPAAAVGFAQFKTGAVIADFIPGDGYYTRILSKVVGPKGKVYGIAAMTWRGDYESMIAENKNLMRHNEEPLPSPNDPILALQNVTGYSNVVALMYTLSSFGGQFSVPEQLDGVWTADHYHELHNTGFGVDDKVPALLKAMFLSLKPGASVTIIDYAAAKGAGLTKTQNFGRIDPETVKAEMIGAGFALDGTSNALANPADDHSKSATDPSLGGKADRFALRFKKPATAGAATMRPAANAMDGYYGNTSHSGIGTPTPRWVFYNPDGTYLEMGEPGAEAAGRGDDTQVGTWYWDASGHNCMIHQWPAEERGFIVCHNSVAIGKKPGDVWSPPGTDRKFTIEAGRHYPTKYGIAGN